MKVILENTITRKSNRVSPTSGTSCQFGVIDNDYVTVLEKLTCQSPRHDQADQRLLDGVAAPKRILNNRELKVDCRLVLLLLDDINLSFDLFYYL